MEAFKDLLITVKNNPGTTIQLIGAGGLFAYLTALWDKGPTSATGHSRHPPFPDEDDGTHDDNPAP